ncbi:hypothetical protein C7H09_08840 [Marinobacter fuscus]|uniref:Type I restriction modification DNA specificity domain-containing protein n=1 Tax=Marinobacter fuscus TaxID=2109942 RepID=A0A2T1KDX8_9GAMM|nr:restriction endonuclease subunit S [Marinobacter fuscus]PSF08260.1 hypothetical protein C7H09_08840 [Marinobacter fuscus]
MQQVLYKLPDGWSWRKLSELAKTTSGGTPSRSNKHYWGGSIPWVKSGELGDSRVEKNEEFITELGLKNSSAKLFPKESLLLALYGATAGKLGVLTYDAATNQAVCCINQDDQLLARDFLRYYLLSQRKKIIEDSFGGAQPNISQAYVREIDIPTPPLTEQKRIVEKLDALLTRIDTAIENLQESIRLADALFSSALNRVFNPSGTKVNFDSCYGLPEGWDWRTVNDLSTKIQYGHTAKAADKGNAQFLRITDIQDNNIDWLGVPFVDLKEKEIEKYALKDNDLVFARSGATAGKSILIKEPPRNAIFASYLIRIVPDKETIQPEYLELFFKSPAYWDIVKANAAGAAQPNINGTKLGEFKVPTPSMEIQKRIVDEMSSLSARVTELKKELRDKVYFIESAKSSILNSAFKGEL